MSAPAVASEPTPGPAHSGLRHLRATVIFLVISILVTGVGYPLLVTGIADVINPNGAGGSLLKDPNGTVIGSSLVAQNLSAPYLFWERYSLTDYNTTMGVDTPPGPSDPALGALLNETLSYMRQYGNYTVDATLPFWLVAPSGSDIDPDLTPEAVLFQVIRVSENTNLSVAWLTDFVNHHISNPVIPFIGVAYVNVLELDIALLPHIGK